MNILYRPKGCDDIKLLGTPFALKTLPEAQAWMDKNGRLGEALAVYDMDDLCAAKKLWKEAWPSKTWDQLRQEFMQRMVDEYKAAQPQCLERGVLWSATTEKPGLHYSLIRPRPGEPIANALQRERTRFCPVFLCELPTEMMHKFRARVDAPQEGQQFLKWVLDQVHPGNPWHLKAKPAEPAAEPAAAHPTSDKTPRGLMLWPEFPTCARLGNYQWSPR